MVFLQKESPMPVPFFFVVKQPLKSLSITSGEAPPAVSLTVIKLKSRDFNLITVKDTAGGASPEVIDKLFSGYFTTKKNGTGIGLSFCKKTMKNFGGDITCHNVYGKYIEFVLSFPKIKNL